MSDHDHAGLLALAARLADDAAALLRHDLARAREIVGTKTSLTDMVTATDHASELLIVEGITSVRPDDAILAEEGTSRAGTTGVRWIIDPLDGTTNYLYGLPAFAVSIGVEVDGQVRVGVVADAARHETFTAVSGVGAWCNGDPITCSTTDELAVALVGTGFSYDPERRARQGAVAAAMLAEVRDIRRVGAASIDLCWVACGRLDAYFERGLAPWDLAAGALIAREAGAVVGDLEGGSPSGGMTLAANPRMFTTIRSRLSALRADTT